MFGNKNCIDKNIQDKLKVKEVNPSSDSVYKSYQISYDDIIINNIDIPKDKFIKDIQLGSSNASLNDDGTINIGDGLKDQICFSISTDTGYNLKLIQLPQGNVTSDDLTEKLKTKADLVNGKVPSDQITIDTELNSNSNNPIASSVVTNNFVKAISLTSLSERDLDYLFYKINEYEKCLDANINQYTLILNVIVFKCDKQYYQAVDKIFITNKQRGVNKICFNSIQLGNIGMYRFNEYHIELKMNNDETTEMSVVECDNNSVISLTTTTFNSNYIKNVLLPQKNYKKNFIIYTSSIEISDTYKILPKNSNNYFIGTFDVNYNYILFTEIGTNSKIYTVSYDTSSYKLSLLNAVDLDLLHNVITYDPEPLPEDTTLGTILKKMGDSSCYKFNVNKTINIDGNDTVHIINCKLTNVDDNYILEGFDSSIQTDYRTVLSIIEGDGEVGDFLKENVSNYSSYTITTEIQNGGTLNGAFNSDKFKEQLRKVTKFEVYNHELNIAKDLTIIVKANNSTVYYKGVIWYVQSDESVGYKYYGEEIDTSSDSENIDKSVIKFDFFDGEVTNFTYNESTTISNLIQNTNTLKTNLSTLSSKHTTDINTLTTKINNKMSVYNGGVYQEDSGSKLALANELKNIVVFDEDGTGVCTINFNNGIFGGSNITNANLVAKVYNIAADNTIEIKGTVTGKYTISGQPKGTVSGDTIGTDDISYVKHYDFDLKWNTSTNKEISYTCKELNVQADLLDTLSYGVRWNSNKSSSPVCQRIGNLQMHRDLPIQNGMKGCIVKFSADKKPEIQYYLDENDWNYISEENRIVSTIKDKNEDSDAENRLYCEGHEYDSKYILGNSEGIDTYNKYVELGKPLFYAIVKKDKNFITEANINNRFHFSPDKGEDYFGTLKKVEIDSNDSSNNKLYFELDKTDIFRFSNCYSIGLSSRLDGYDGEVMVEVPEFYIRSWEKDNGDKEVRISQCKIDDTWEKQPHCLISPYCVTLLREVPENMGYLSTLPVNSAISVCNTETYCRGGNNDSIYDKYLTTDPFRTSLGKPATNIARASMRVNCRKSKDKEVMSYNQYKRILYWLYVIEYANFNCQLTYNSKLDSNRFKQGGLGNGVTTVDDEWSYYNNYRPITYNGYTNSLGNNTGIISMSVTMPKDKENTSTVIRTMNVPRWHGIENPFGDIWKNVDGIIINYSSIDKDGVKYSEVYTTDNTALYSDSNYESMKKVGIELNQTGYIKEYNLGNTAEIIPRFNNASYYTYKCDYHPINSAAGLRTLFLGGTAGYGGAAGFGCFYSLSAVNAVASNFGFRSSSNLE